MATYRQIQLRLAGEESAGVIDLNTSPYKVEAGSWRSELEELQVRIVIQASTLAELYRYSSVISQALAQARAYALAMHPLPVYVYMKTADALTTTADIGATWLRKIIRGGRLTVEDPSERADGQYTVLATLALEVDAYWQRATPAQILQCVTGAASLTTNTDGSLTVANARVELYARRRTWTSSTGITVRTFWKVATGTSVQINLLRLSANFRAYLNPNTGVHILSDETGTVASGNLALTNGATYEVVVRMGGSDNGLWINGTRVVTYKNTLTWPSDPNLYRVLDTSGACGTQQFYSIQVWPTLLTDAQIAELRNWGRPEPSLAWANIGYSATALTALSASVYNVAGDSLAPMRLVLNGSESFDQLRVHMRALMAPAAAAFECESAMLGANTASNSNASASGGSQARFTPADTAWATRVTVALASDPDEMAALRGRHRLFLAGYDSAAGTNVNQVRWRLVVAGVAEDWSEERAFAAVSTRSLLDLGTVDMPPGAWPDEAVLATTDLEAGTFVTVEIQAANSTGSGGGTLDLDALYLAPAELELLVQTPDYDGSDEWIVVDFVSMQMNAVTVRSYISMEWATWGAMVGDRLMLTPRAGLSAFVWLYAYRDADEQAFPNDTATWHIDYQPQYDR